MTEITGEFPIEVGYALSAMAEWLILLLLVPAVVMPVVLLVGFAGCDDVLGLTRFDAEPFLDPAVGRGVSRITLTWGYAAPVQKFELIRINPDNTQFPFEALASPFDDTGHLPGDAEGLQPQTSYTYRVAAVLNDGSMTKWSGDVTGTTLGFQTVFDETFAFEDPTLGHDLGGWEGFTIVQRIEPATSAIRYEDGVPSSKSTAWWKKVAEADGTTRSATYTSEARIYLIEKVEVG